MNRFAAVISQHPSTGVGHGAILFIPIYITWAISSVRNSCGYDWRCLTHHDADELRHQKYYGFEFMQDLINEMTHINPAKRPSIEEVVARVSRIRESLSRFKLRSTIIAKHDPSLFSMFRRARQALRTIRYMFSHKAAIPEAS